MRGGGNPTSNNTLKHVLPQFKQFKLFLSIQTHSFTSTALEKGQKHDKRIWDRKEIVINVSCERSKAPQQVKCLQTSSPLVGEN